MDKNAFQCFICRNVLTEPVTSPCGHNFCKICLMKSWKENGCCHCPKCNKMFETRPNLEVNYLLSIAISQLQMADQEKVPAKPGEVPCDICIDIKQKALRACLECKKRLCQMHLEYHDSLENSDQHKQISDVENMEMYLCSKHQRPLELFCKNDRICVCQFCTDGDHKNHNTVVLEEESAAAKKTLKFTQARMQSLTLERLAIKEKIKQLMKLIKESIDKDIVDSVAVFDGLIDSITESQSKFLEVMEETWKATEKKGEEFLNELEQEITELRRKDAELEQLSHTENHLQLLQMYQSVNKLPNTKAWTDINIINTHQSGEILREALSQLQKTLKEKIYETEMKRMKQYTVDVLLDPSTAHDSLVISDDKRQVKKRSRGIHFGFGKATFNPITNVLGSEGFSTGKFYYEVLVTTKNSWGLGVARESVISGMDISLSPTFGFWNLFQIENAYKVVNSNSSFTISMREKPQKVGVFVDYEGGLVSFCDVMARSHIYSFTDQTFNGKLFPYFNPGPNDGGRNSAPLIVLPINHTD